MKKIIYSILLISGLLAGFTSCNKFLEEDNKTGETAALSYQTKTGISGLVNSCYLFARGWWGKEASLGLSEMGTDLFQTGMDCKQLSLATYNFTSASLGDDTSNNPSLDQYWELFYAGIDVCNNALKYVPECSVLSETDKSKYMGEIYFLRALYYFQLVSIWGPVPYNDEPISAVNTTPVRVPESQMFKNIMSDIEKSMNLLEPTKASKQEEDQTNAILHAGYYAAEALKARVALFAASWLGDASYYNIAKAAAEDVINNSGKSMYDRYSDTWNFGNESAAKNSECIWGVYYSDELTTAVNCTPYRYTDQGTGTYNSLITRTGHTRGGSCLNLLMTPVWNNGCGDLGGSGQKNTQVFVRVTSEASSYILSKTTGENVNVAKYYSPYSRGFTRFLPSLYLWKTLDEIKDTDQRFDATLVTHYNIPKDLAGNASKYYPDMANQEFKDYDEAYAEDGNYFNGGGYAIRYVYMDGDSPEGKALQAEAKNKYRLQFAYGGDIPVYSSGDFSTAVRTQSPVKVSSVYGDDRYNNAKIGGYASFPGFKKYLESDYDSRYPTHDVSSRDFMVFRIAEMYLIKAEAEMKTSGDALATLNVLRAKRAVTGKDNSLSGTVDIDMILRERTLELCGEYHRWFDLKRTHTLVDRVKNYNAQAKDNIQLKHYYRPIPDSQMIAVTNKSESAPSQKSDGVLDYSAQTDGFWQNPGW